MKSQHVVGFARAQRRFKYFSAGSVEQLGDDVFAGEPGAGCFSLNRHRGVLEGGLGNVDLAQSDIAEGGFAADDDRVNGRKSSQVRGRAVQVGGITVGQEHHAGEGATLEAFFQTGQGRSERGGAAIEGELVKISRGLKPRIKIEASNFVIVFEGRLPARVLRVEQSPELVGAQFRRVCVFDLQALTVVGEDGENVGAGPCVLS